MSNGDQTTRKSAIIIGAGPAGLTAAYELLRQTNVLPIVLEKSRHTGGISRTEIYKGNRIDIGGHRFFSKSDRVIKWWFEMLPLQKLDDQAAHWKAITSLSNRPDPDETDNVMLLRERKSRILFLRKLFDYPLSLSKATLMNLGPARVLKILASYIKTKIFPIHNEQNLEEFFINRFGRELYDTFFKSYTEKVWGVPCHEISAAWGAQRIKGLSITRAILHILKNSRGRGNDIGQKNTETSLIERFYYPKLGPGLMWETCAEKITEAGGKIEMEVEVDRVLVEGKRIKGVEAVDGKTGERKIYEADYVISSMAVQDLVRAIGNTVPGEMKQISDGLIYRDFLTVGLLVNKLKLREPDGSIGLIKDNWIYIQEPDVQVGRLQIFNNWSPYMAADPNTVWVGLEYFCNEGDALWNKDDESMIKLGIEELSEIGIIDQSEVLDATVIRQEKTYPAYFGTYDRFRELRNYLDEFENLFLIGRNGMHRYNNQDHSMLTAMITVENISKGESDKSNIWSVNAEDAYHEEK